MTTDLHAPVRPRRSAALRRLVVDSPGSLGGRARARRWNVVRAQFPKIEDMTVLDLGGTAESWRRAPVRPRHVTVVNLTEPGESNESWLKPVLGDACDARAALKTLDLPTRYDLVFSNSLIEHVGGHAKRTDLANEVHELAPYHWVQTPYRFFPIEPHWLCPMMQFLPAAARVSVARWWPLVHTRPHSRAEAEQEVLWTELLSVTELSAYFPTSKIVRERIAGVTKSITAVNAPPA
jgi:hypothetical protein